MDNLQQLIYGSPGGDASTDAMSQNELENDCNRFDASAVKLRLYKQTNYKKLLKKKFITGISKDKILENLMNMSDSDEEGDKAQRNAEKDQLRKMEDNSRKGSKLDKKRKRMENKGIKVDTDSDENSEQIDDASGDEAIDKIQKKLEKKEEPETTHKPLKKTAEEIKKSLFLGEKYGHYKIGCYVQIELQVEKKFARQLKPEYPMILCSLKHQETGFAFVRVKIKKHRWYPHVLKTKDPITFSMGWRKFQSIPIFAQQGDAEDERTRMIKYTPKFSHCYAIFYAPTCAVGTPFVGI